MYCIYYLLSKIKILCHDTTPRLSHRDIMNSVIMSLMFIICLVYLLSLCSSLCYHYVHPHSLLLTIAILSTIVHNTMCYCNVNTISKMLHLLTPSPLPCHAMLYRILMTLYFYTCMIMNVKDLFLTPPALNMNMNYYLYS